MARAAASLAAGRGEGLIERPRAKDGKSGKSGKRAVALSGRRRPARPAKGHPNNNGAQQAVAHLTGPDKIIKQCHLSSKVMHNDHQKRLSSSSVLVWACAALSNTCISWC